MIFVSQISLYTSNQQAYEQTPHAQISNEMQMQIEMERQRSLYQRKTSLWKQHNVLNVNAPEPLKTCCVYTFLKGQFT